MRRHLQNLERLCFKFQALYGEQDPLVQQFRQSLIETRKQLDAVPKMKCANPGRRATPFQPRSCRL